MNLRRVLPLVLIVLATVPPVRGQEPGTRSFVLAALSLTPEPCDKEANVAKLERYAREARQGVRTSRRA